MLLAYNEEWHSSWYNRTQPVWLTCDLKTMAKQRTMAKHGIGSLWLCMFPSCFHLLHLVCHQLRVGLAPHQPQAALGSRHKSTLKVEAAPRACCSGASQASPYAYSLAWHQGHTLAAVLMRRLLHYRTTPQSNTLLAYCVACSCAGCGSTACTSTPLYKWIWPQPLEPWCPRPA